MSRSKISARDFIKAWQTSDTIEDVISKTKMSRAAINSRAYIYKKRGVPLKKMENSGGYDWDKLAEYAELFVENEQEPSS